MLAIASVLTLILEARPGWPVWLVLAIIALAILVYLWPGNEGQRGGILQFDRWQDDDERRRRR
jgi:hypothetical protein